MLVMAIRTLHLSFANRVVRLFGDLYSKFTMAGYTKVWLGSLEIHLLPGVDRVTPAASNIGRFVNADIPVGKTAGIGMAVKAFCRFGRRISLPVTERKHACSLTPAFLDMIHTLVMAGFTSLSIRRTFINPFIRVNGC